MPDWKRLTVRTAQKLKLPSQLAPGVPLIELIGKNTLIITRHRGLTQYTAQRICARSSLGLIAVTGRELHITQMNGQTLTVSGTICGVSISEEGL